MQKTFHLQQPIETMTFPEVDIVRRRHEIPITTLCENAQVAPSTYQRWLAYVRGKDGGCKPHRNSMRAVRSALQALVDARIKEEERSEAAKAELVAA